MLFAIDDQGRRGIHVIRLRIGLIPRHKRLCIRVVGKTRLELVILETRHTADPAQVFRDQRRIATACDPFGLLSVKQVGNSEELGGIATRHHRGPQPETVKIDVAIDEAYLSGIHVFGLELLQRAIVETGAMRAGERGVFDQCDRCIFRAHHHLDNAGGVDVGGLRIGDAKVRHASGGRAGQ